MFETFLWRGCVNRVLKKMENTGVDNPALSFIASSIACANYPKGYSTAIEHLAPIISLQEVQKMTENYLGYYNENKGEKRVNSINDLYNIIWGLGVDEYLARVAESDAIKSQNRKNTILNDVIRSYDVHFESKDENKREMHSKRIELVKSWVLSGNCILSKTAIICSTLFVCAELDYITTGNRGLGRMNDSIPRFGGKHRALLKRIDMPRMLKIRNAFTDIVLCGYLFVDYQLGMLMPTMIPRHKQMENEKKLYEQWIPSIYSSIVPVPSFEKNIMSVVDKDTYLTLKSIWGFVIAHRIFDLLKNINIQITDQEKCILYNYFNGGMALRLLESNPMTKEQHDVLITGGGCLLD